MTLGNRPAPEQGSWQLPGATSAHQPPDEATRGDGRGRPGVAALVVALVELVIIAAACNQAVSKHTERYFLDHETTFLGRAVGSSLKFAWRVTPASGDNKNGYHIWASELVAIGVFVVVSALLAGLAVRGTVTFWRAFFGIWTAVLAAACLSHVAAAFVTKTLPANVDRATGAVFNSVDGLVFFAGVVIGLVVALIAALFAVATRRAADRPAAAPAPAEPAYVPENPPPFYGAPRHAQPAAQPTAQPTAEPAQETDGRTMQIPRFDPRGGQQWSPPAGEAQTTTGLPRAEDGGSTQAMPSAPDDDRPTPR